MAPHESIAADALDACVTCGMCLNACPTYALSGIEGYSPRGRIVTLRHRRDGTADMEPMLDEYLDTCLGCRACELVCPSGVPYGRILEHHRAERGAGRLEKVALWVLARRWRLSVVSLPLWIAQRTRLLAVLVWLADHHLAPRALRNARGIPPIKFLNLVLRLSTNYVPPKGTGERGQVVLFAGCVQDAWARDVHWATISLLTAAGYRVRMPYGQVCCGALHAHAGELDRARKLALANVEPLERYEGSIVVNSAGCGAKLKEYGELVPGDEHVAAVALRVRDVSEVLTPDDVKALRPRPPEGLERIAIHDPCHLNFVQRISAQPRELLRAAGYEVADLADGGRCCGAAGSYAVAHPEWAEPLRDEKLAAVAATRPDAVAVANPGCLFWMSAGKGAPPMYHPVQLIAMAVANGRRERDRR